MTRAWIAFGLFLCFLLRDPRVVAQPVVTPPEEPAAPPPSEPAPAVQAPTTSEPARAAPQASQTSEASPPQAEPQPTEAQAPTPTAPAAAEAPNANEAAGAAPSSDASASAPQPPAGASGQASPAAPAAAAESPERRASPEAAAEQKPSFLDPHPAGSLPPIYARDERTHRGFSVRVSAGLGFGSARRKLSRGSYKVSGLSGVLSLDVGASVIDNLIVYGRFSGFAWNSLRDSDAANAGGAFFGLLGAGARYYLMPWNAFASATLGITAMQVLDDLGESQNAHPGFGFELELGHDFWAGTPLDRRAVGLALRFAYVTCGAAGTGQKDPKAWNSLALSLVFSAAYN